MKFLSIFLTAIYLSFAFASPADAAPVIAFVGAAWSALTATAVGSVVANLLVSTALSALSAALAPKQKMGGAGITTEYTQTGGDNPLSMTFGTYMTAGTHVCPPMTFGFSDDGSGAEWLIQVISLGDKPITSLEKVVIDGSEYNLIPFDPNESYYEGKQFQGYNVSGKLNHKCVIRFHDGTQTTSDSILTQYFSNYPERPWSSNHILTGTPYVVVFYKHDPEKFPGLPDAKFVIKGCRLYDPRKDSTVGGSGTQRWNNQNTWAYSDNPVVQIYNVIRGIPIPGGLTYGIGAPADSIPLSKWFAMMNRCDVVVGGEKTYRSSVEFNLDTEPLELIEILLAACGGSLSEYGGFYNIVVGAPSTAAASFSDDDLVITENRDFNVFEGLQQTYNGVTASYPDPSALWETKEAVPYHNATWEAQDEGRRLIADLKLPAVPYPRQVRRLMREMASDNRRTRKHSVTLPPAFIGVKVLDSISWTSQNNGYNGKLFEVISKTIDPYTLCVTLGLRERDPSDYDYDSDFDGTLPVYPSATPVVITPVGVYGFSANDMLLQDAQGRPRRAAIQISWNPEVIFQSIAYEIRNKTTQQIVAKATTSNVRDGAVIVAEGIIPSTEYEVRIKGIIPTRETQWSGWLTVTTKAATIVNDDFADGIQKLFRDQNLTAIEYFSVLPQTGAFDGQLVFNTTNGKLYRWVTSPAPAKWVAVVENAIQGVLDETSFATGISIPRVVSSLPTTGNFEGRIVTLTTDGKLYRYVGGAWTSAVPAVDVSGTLTSAQIATGAILSDKLANNAVSLAKLADGAVNSAKLLDGAVSELKIANNAVTSTAIAVGAITANTIAAGAITETKIANNAITTPKIAAGAVVANTIAAGAVTANSIAAGAVIAGKIAVGAVVANSIAANAVTAYAIAANTITSNEIAAGAITGAKIAANTITAVQISANTITAAEIAAGAITSEKIAAGAVEANSIAANAITSDKIESNAITSAKIAAGAIGAGQIAANAIVASKLAITDFTNLVPDDQMQDRDSWIVNAAGLPVVTHLPNQGTVTARSRGIFQVNPNGTNITQLVSKLSSAKPDNEYYFAGQFYSAATATVNLILQFLDVNTDVIGNKNIASTGTGWRIISDSVVAPTGTIYVRLVYQINASSYGGDIIYLAAPVIRAKTAGALIVDGTITGDKIVAQTITGGLLASAGIITNSAQINNAVITNAKIANLSVDRLKIADNAVSVQVSSTGNGNLTVAFNNPQTSTVTFGYFGKGYSTKTGNGGLVWYRGGGQLRMDNNIVDSTEMFNIEDSGYAQIGLIRQMTLAAGNHNAAFTTSYDMRAGLLFVIIQYK